MPQLLIIILFLSLFIIKHMHSMDYPGMEDVRGCYRCIGNITQCDDPEEWDRVLCEDPEEKYCFLFASTDR